MFKNWLQFKFLYSMYYCTNSALSYPGFQMLWELWLPRPRSGHWLLQAASWSLGRGQAEESRKTQSEIIQAIVRSQLRKLASGRHWKAQILQIQTQYQSLRIKLSEHCFAQGSPKPAGAEETRSGRPQPVLLCRGWPQWSVRGSEAAQLRPRPGAESPRLDNWLDQDAYF